MLRRYGRYQGDIQNFELWDPKRTNQKAGFYFTAVAEWLPDEGGWISVCEKCHNFRCLKIDIQKQTWQCSKCGRKGSFKKPEEKKKLKTKRLPKGKKKEWNLF